MSASLPAWRTNAMQAADLFRLQDVITELAIRGRRVIPLMQGESDLPTPAHIVEAGTRALAEGHTRYAPGLGDPELRAAVAAKVARENRLTVDPGREVFVTSGGGLGVLLAVVTAVDPGDEVILADPTYGPFVDAVRLAGATPVFVPRTVDAAGQLRWDATAVEGAITPRTRSLLLDTPSAPTGSVLSAEELAALAEVALRHSLWLISDEVFEAIIFDGRSHVSIASLAPEVAARTISVFSCSKSYAMTGWRLGYTTGPAPLIAAMERTSLAFGRPAATFVQRAGIVALTGPQEFPRRLPAVYGERRAQVEARLAAMPGIDWVQPEGAFYVFLDFSRFGSDSAVLAERVVRGCGVGLTPGSFYGPGGAGWLRLSFAGGPRQTLEGLDALGEMLGRWEAGAP